MAAWELDQLGKTAHKMFDASHIECKRVMETSDVIYVWHKMLASSVC